MANILFELDKLRIILKTKGIDSATVEIIVTKASREIANAFDEIGHSALQDAIEEGVEKKSPDFINELRLDSVNLRLTTDSGNTEFIEPPYPMLSRLLTNAKPMKDGSGVYKVIPVGGNSTEKQKISTNIYDAAKQINAERVESAKRQYASISPKDSKAIQFRTATSKQDATQQWVIPAKHKDFTEKMTAINKDLAEIMDSKIRDIIREYEESF